MNSYVKVWKKLDRKDWPPCVVSEEHVLRVESRKTHESGYTYLTLVNTFGEKFYEPAWKFENAPKPVRDMSGTDIAAKANPLDVQVGGEHYNGKTIQPVEYIVANNLSFLEGCIVKRITRWRNGGKGVEDLKKIKHEVDLILALEVKE